VPALKHVKLDVDSSPAQSFELRCRAGPCVALASVAATRAPRHGRSCQRRLGAFGNAPNCRRRAADAVRDAAAPPSLLRAATPGHRGGRNGGATATPWPSLSAARSRRVPLPEQRVELQRVDYGAWLSGYSTGWRDTNK